MRTACVSKEEHCIKPFVYRYFFCVRELRRNCGSRSLKSSSGALILEPRSSNLDPRTPNLDPRSPILHPRFFFLGPSCSILHPRYSILRPRSSIFDLRTSIHDPLSFILDPRSSTLVNRILNKTIHTIPSNITQIHVSG